MISIITRIIINHIIKLRVVVVEVEDEDEERGADES